MEQVFAPWRIDWVEREDRDVEGCVFCALPDRLDDAATRIVARNDHAYVLLNNYPYNPGHAMVIPHVHGGSYDALDADVLASHARLTQQTLTALRAAFDPDAFNTGMNLGGGPSGGSVDDHVHRHVVPRWAGDTNFMPVVSDTKVIVQALEDTYAQLHDAFGDLEAATGLHEGGAVELASA